MTTTRSYCPLHLGKNRVGGMGPSTLSPSVRACPVEGGELPDCAGIIAALEATTQKKVEVIVGKPSPITMQVALEVMGLGAAECILIGDRLETDIRMGLEAGMKTALVMTGVTDAKTLEASPVRPDYVFQSIADLEDLL